MPEPTIAARSPFKLKLEPGEYWWCQCGQSKNQPFCDGSHKTTPFTPVKFTIAEPKEVSLCACKHTHKAPFCDGTHKTLAAPQG